MARKKKKIVRKGKMGCKCNEKRKRTTEREPQTNTGGLVRQPLLGVVLVLMALITGASPLFFFGTEILGTDMTTDVGGGLFSLTFLGGLLVASCAALVFLMPEKENHKEQ